MFKKIKAQLFAWFKIQRHKSVSLSKVDIKKKAFELKEQFNIELKLTASTGWFYNFLKRHRNNRCASTHRIQKFSNEYLKEIEDFLTNLKK